MCWAIWKARNDLIFNGREILPSLVAGNADMMLKEFQESSLILSSTEPHSSFLVSQASPISSNFRVYCHAAFSKSDSSAAIGCALFDLSRFFFFKEAQAFKKLGRLSVILLK